MPPRIKRPRFKYVYVPANCADAIEERELEMPEGKEVECLLDAVKEHFAGVGGKTDAGRKSQREQLMSQLGQQASMVDPSMLERALDMQMVENVMLLPNNQETGYAGVNLYCDDQAQFKQLELNPRASQIAMCAGKPLEVRGDVFLARVFDNEKDFQRMDFTLSEMSSSASWVMQAADIARRKAADPQVQNEFLDRVNKPQTARPARPAATVRELTPAEVEKEEGNAAVKRGDWDAALQRYTAALELDPGLTAARNNRALALIKLKRYAEAEADCDAVVEKEPRNVKALLRRISAREAQQGRAQDVLADAESVLKLEPQNKEATTAKQRVLEAQMGDIEDM
uniref:Uncharacterized protein n=1 Tax=Chlamydomonas euryale TaxID=1486919 RepID=A0A7R9VTC5_9CHLO